VALTSDATGKSWSGKEKIAFTNTGQVPITDFWIRLWDNGYAGCTASLAERISALTGGTAAETAVDCTAVRIVLATPLKAGAHGIIGFDLAIDVPDQKDRFGSFNGRSYLGNAIPLVAVKDEHGWELSPYVKFGESFYSLIADFDVTLDHPSSLLTPSSGFLADDHTVGERTVTHVSAPKIRDFVWSIGAFTHDSTKSVAGVEVDAYWPSTASDSASRDLMAYAAQALDSYSARYGSYPYPRYTVIFDDFGTAFGGMEYPTYALSLPDKGTLAHETAHQWWYALVGDDPYRYPWIKESLGEYSAEEFQGATIPAHSCTFLAPNERMDQTMETYELVGDYLYHDAIYHEGTCMWFDLENSIGRDAMNTFLRNLLQKFEYGIVRPADVRAAAQAVTSVDLSGFWAKWRNEGG
jgi:hypothetical protein